MTHTVATLKTSLRLNDPSALAELRPEARFLAEGVHFERIEGLYCDAYVLVKALEEKFELKTLFAAAMTRRFACDFESSFDEDESDQPEKKKDLLPNNSSETSPLDYFDAELADLTSGPYRIVEEEGGKFAMRIAEDYYDKTEDGKRVVKSTVTFVYVPSRLGKDERLVLLDTLKKSLIANSDAKKKKPNIFLIVSNSMEGMFLRQFDISVPKTFDLSFYGKDFEAKANTIISRMNSKANGAYLFGGAYGAGKTTFIKWLTTKVSRKFIFIPEHMATSLNDPSLQSLLLDNAGAIFVIEDAEKVLASRESGNSFVSSVLNMTDGITANAFQCSVILTFNSEKENFDKAIFRKGRLQAEHDFLPLPPEEANRVAAKLGKEPKYVKATPLCDIIHTDDNFHAEKKTEKFGF